MSPLANLAQIKAARFLINSDAANLLVVSTAFAPPKLQQGLRSPLQLRGAEALRRRLQRFAGSVQIRARYF